MSATEVVTVTDIDVDGTWRLFVFPKAFLEETVVEIQGKDHSYLAVLDVVCGRSKVVDHEQACDAWNMLANAPPSDPRNAYALNQLQGFYGPREGEVLAGQYVVNTTQYS